MTQGNFTFYINGLPYDGADLVISVASKEAKCYNKPITVRCTFTDDELIIHREVIFATVYPSGNILWSMIND